MLLAALVLLLVAAGLLVTSFSTGETVWAWVSIGVSGVAAMALVVRWWRSRRHRAAMSGRHRSAADRVSEPTQGSVAAAGDAPPDTPVPAAEGTGPEFADTTSEGDAADAGDTAWDIPAVDEKFTGETSDPAVPVARDELEPPEEDTDAADLLVVCEISDEVVVVDERPRYHLSDCRWLASRPIEPLPVREARELGFTPCARCGPDAELASRHRRARID